MRRARHHPCQFDILRKPMCIETWCRTFLDDPAVSMKEPGGADEGVASDTLWATPLVSRLRDQDGFHTVFLDDLPVRQHGDRQPLGVDAVKNTAEQVETARYQRGVPPGRVHLDDVRAGGCR